MTRDEVMERARAAGLTVEPCALETLIAVRAGEAPKDSNERMRMTAEGALMTVADGHYWQVGTVEDIDHYVRSLP